MLFFVYFLTDGILLTAVRSAWTCNGLGGRADSSGSPYYLKIKKVEILMINRAGLTDFV